jgi:hypothetical protein
LGNWGIPVNAATTTRGGIACPELCKDPEIFLSLYTLIRFAIQFFSEVGMSRTYDAIDEVALFKGLSDRSSEALDMFCWAVLPIAKGFLRKHSPDIPYEDMEDLVWDAIFYVWNNVDKVLIDCERAGRKDRLTFVVSRVLHYLTYRTLDYRRARAKARVRLVTVAFTAPDERPDEFWDDGEEPAREPFEELEYEPLNERPRSDLLAENRGLEAQNAKLTMIIGSLKRGISRLPGRQKVLVERAIENDGELDFSALANEFGTSPSTLRSQFSQAKRNLRNDPELREFFPEEPDDENA